MSGRGNAQGAIEAGRRMLEQAVDGGIKRAHGPPAKPSLKRYSWSRLHSDLLDDFRWSLVAKRANAPLPLVEAVLIRLENHANRSRPRGYVGDFSVEGLAARWNVDEDTIGRIFAELERSDVGWIDQDQIVSFWDRNPDIVDETAAERMQRMRDRKKGMKQLSQLAAQGLITEQQRQEREHALKESREPKSVMATWAEVPTGALRRNTVTVTTRADQTIKQGLPGKEKRGSPGEGSVSGFGRHNAVKIVDFGKAQQWIETDGLALVTARMSVMRSRASQLFERWAAGINGDLVTLVAIVLGVVATARTGESFGAMVEDQIGLRRQEAKGPRLPLPPVGLRGGSSGR